MNEDLSHPRSLMGHDILPTLISGYWKQTGTTQDELTIIGGGKMTEAFEIGNGQTAQTRLGEVCGSLDCMHDQKAILECGGGC